ncbi:tripartite tricarboxylate transporter substrate binding protein [Paracidovorax wautersii]|uniref:Tripartite-type tricarboxylate transporter receptor subunit TctC n=1 Tax=Paracidovorax wautersii TaxID=1177982 RepID=A0ABU1IDV1_9BURK|nr:tripartite tricarboxylate transporter substrate binding protein [Paracidovorax wautersii]MDR6215388.1 tripartite-type tricarboxylate transporter receptor subunit TctC [Paracidovorax wautersii]
MRKFEPKRPAALIHQALEAITFACLAVAALPVQAQGAWPDKPIKLVVPYPAGGNADNTARLLATQLSGRLGQQVVVDNRPGGSGTIGAAAVAKAAPDGYTLLLDATAFTVNPSLFAKLPYDAAKDFAPISLVLQVPLLMVVPASSPLQSVADLATAARAQPGRITYASAGNGGAQHLAGELYKQGAKVSMTHIPYRGGAPALTDLIGGQVDVMFSATTASGPFVKSGKLRALAITSARRTEGWEQVPTLAESGVPGFQVNEWNGLFAPAGTPQPVLQRLEAETRAIVASPEVKRRFAELGVQGVGSSAQEFAAFVQAEAAQWARVIRTSGIRMD